MSFVLPLAAREAAQAHALRDYPKEACGLLVDGAYLPCINYAVDPERDFVIAAFLQKKLREEGREVQAVIHSHPDGPLFPSESDMIGQISMDIPWAIIPTNGEECADPIIWGDTVDQGPILERPFRHGVTDCYELVRHTFAAGKDELTRQGVTTEWMLEPVELRPQARADGWWDTSVEATNRSLYDDFRNVGFREIKESEVLPGDCFLMKLGHKFATLNHGGIYVGSNLILHHLPTRVSRREPIGVWLRAVEKWLRHESLDRYLEEQERSHA